MSFFTFFYYADFVGFVCGEKARVPYRRTWHRGAIWIERKKRTETISQWSAYGRPILPRSNPAGRGHHWYVIIIQKLFKSFELKLLSLIEYQQFSNELKEYLKKFADNKKIVRPEDIAEFFTKLKERKRRRMDDGHADGTPSHFCRWTHFLLILITYIQLSFFLFTFYVSSVHRATRENVYYNAARLNKHETMPPTHTDYVLVFCLFYFSRGRLSL